MTTNCHQFKTWLSDQDIEDKSLEREARDHMETCEICKKLATVDSLIEARVREGLRQVDPPRELFARIETDLRSAARGEKDERGSIFPWKKLVPAFVMAAVVLMIVLNPFSGGIGSIEQIGSYALANHLDPQHTMAFRAENVSDVRMWYATRVGFPAELPRRNVQGLAFLGGGECHFGKYKAAYLFCEKFGIKVSIFVIDPGDLGFALEEDKSYSLYNQGHEIKIWKEKGQVYAMVALEV